MLPQRPVYRRDTYKQRVIAPTNDFFRSDFLCRTTFLVRTWDLQKQIRKLESVPLGPILQGKGRRHPIFNRVAFFFVHHSSAIKPWVSDLR